MANVTSKEKKSKSKKRKQKSDPHYTPFPKAISVKKGGTVSRKAGSSVGTRTALELEAHKVLDSGPVHGKSSFEDISDKALKDLIKKYKKKGGAIKRKIGGTVKKQVGGLPQGYNARLDESLAARHPATRGNLAARRAESEGMERALGRRPYSAASTMAKKGGSVRRKKGSTVSRKGGGKIMQGYKAGGKV
jgi:hypothetical protein